MASINSNDVNEIIELDPIVEQQRRRRNKLINRQMRLINQSALVEVERSIMDLVDREMTALSIDRVPLTIDRAAEEDAAAAAVAAAAASGNYDLNKVRNYKDMLKYTTNLSDGIPMATQQDINNLTLTEDVSIILSAYLLH